MDRWTDQPACSCATQPEQQVHGDRIADTSSMPLMATVRWTRSPNCFWTRGRISSMRSRLSMSRNFWIGSLSMTGPPGAHALRGRLPVEDEPVRLLVRLDAYDAVCTVARHRQIYTAPPSTYLILRRRNQIHVWIWCPAIQTTSQHHDDRGSVGSKDMRSLSDPTFKPVRMPRFSFQPFNIIKHCLD